MVCAECPHSFVPSLWSRQIPQLCTELMPIHRGCGSLGAFPPIPCCRTIAAPSSRCGAQGCSPWGGSCKISLTKEETQCCSVPLSFIPPRPLPTL